MQFSMFGHSGLNEQRGTCRINARSQPINDHVPYILFNDLRRIVMRGERMPIGNKEQALKFLLHFNPIF